MRGVNDRNFLNLWQIVYRATCPGPAATQWRCGPVDWRKDRHSFSGAEYAVTLEVHHLQHRGGAGAAWTLLVSAEHWWGKDGVAIKSTTWARVTAGDGKAVIAWLRQHEGQGALSAG